MRPYQWFQLLKKRFKIIFNENSSASWGSFFSYILSNLKFRKNLCVTLHGFAHIQGYFEPSEGNFIMQVVDIQAFSVMFAAPSIPDSWSRIYRGILSLLREIL